MPVGINLSAVAVPVVLVPAGEAKIVAMDGEHLALRSGSDSGCFKRNAGEHVKF